MRSCRVYPACKHKTDFGIHFLFSDVTVFLEGEERGGSVLGPDVYAAF